MGRTKAATTKARPKVNKTAVKLAQQVQQNKKALLEALEKSLGVVTTACKAVGLDRASHYRYMNDDPAYAEAVAAIDDVALDFAESQLHKQIQKGEVTSTIFFLKTKGKKRGYIERQEVGIAKLDELTDDQLQAIASAKGTG